MSVETKITTAVEGNAVSAKPLLGCDLRRELEYISKKEHCWDPQAYRNSTINGRLATGDEISFKLQYCVGSAYLRGFSTNMYFQIFYRDNQGFQVYVANSYKELDEMKRCTFSEMPGEQYEVYKRLMEYQAKSK